MQNLRPASTHSQRICQYDVYERQDAARFGLDEIVADLINAGAKVNHRGFHGWSALHLSQLHNHDFVTVRLLEAGADKDVLDNNGVKARDANKDIRIWGCISIKPL